MFTGLFKVSLAMLAGGICAGAGLAQVPPSALEIERYKGLFAAAHAGDLTAVRQLAGPETVARRDGHGRTPLHVAAYAGRREVMKALVAAGADPNALDRQRYDVVTIAAVADDRATLEVALETGTRPGNVTSPYDGTALIAAAHLGHVGPVRALIAAGAPLDHVNNLGWTALIEAIVLGDGGARHTEIVRLLLEAGADPDLADASGTTPVELARGRGYTAIAGLIETRLRNATGG